MLSQEMSRHGVGDPHLPWETLLGPSVAWLQEKLPSVGSWTLEEVFAGGLEGTFKALPGCGQ